MIMRKIWLIAAQEYRRNVFKRSFLLVILSVPAFIVFSVGVGIFIESLQESNEPVGYVDMAGFTIAPAERSQLVSDLMEEEVSLNLVLFENQSRADAAVEQGSVQAYFLIPPDYLQRPHVNLIFTSEPGSNVTSEFETFLRINLVSQLDPETARRVVSGTDISVRSLDGKRVIPGTGATVGVLLPLFICIAFLFLIMMSSGYMMGAIAEEKENRTIELLTTSVSSSKFIAGKIIGTVGIGLTIFFTWIVVVLIGLFIASQIGVSWLENMVVDWRSIMATTAIAIPAFILVAAVMTGIGAIVTTTQEGQSFSAVFFILHFVPFYVAWIFATEPHSPLAVSLSLMPFTALLSTGLRNLFTIVPAWQIYASAAIQLALALGAIWLASRAFRLGMLQYGQRISLRRLMRVS